MGKNRIGHLQVLCITHLGDIWIKEQHRAFFIVNPTFRLHIHSTYNFYLFDYDPSCTPSTSANNKPVNLFEHLYWRNRDPEDSREAPRGGGRNENSNRLTEWDEWSDYKKISVHTRPTKRLGVLGLSLNYFLEYWFIVIILYLQSFEGACCATGIGSFFTCLLYTRPTLYPF